MRNLYAIYRKEMRHYFVSPVAYVCIGLFLLISAFFFNFFLAAVIQQSFHMEMLMTSPISEIQIVLGKFLASLSLFALMLLPTGSYVVYMYLHSDPIPPWRMLFAGYAGILLLGGSLLALGTFISSLTENQLIAAVLTFVAFLFLWVLDLGHTSEGGLGSVLQYLSASRHYDDFARGIIDTSGLIYYFSFMLLFVFLTVRSIDSMRWRRAYIHRAQLTIHGETWSM